MVVFVSCMVVLFGNWMPLLFRGIYYIIHRKLSWTVQGLESPCSLHNPSTLKLSRTVQERHHSCPNSKILAPTDGEGGDGWTNFFPGPALFPVSPTLHRLLQDSERCCSASTAIHSSADPHPLNGSKCEAVDRPATL